MKIKLLLSFLSVGMFAVGLLALGERSHINSTIEENQTNEIVVPTVANKHLHSNKQTQQVIELGAGKQLHMTIAEKASCVTVSQYVVNSQGEKGTKTCTVTCDGNSYTWTCSEDQSCSGDCSDPKNPSGSCT